MFGRTLMATQTSSTPNLNGGPASAASDVGRLHAGIMQLKKRVGEIEALLRTENASDVATAERKQKSCNVRLLGLEGEAELRCNTAHPFWIHVRELRHRLELTEAAIDRHRRSKGGGSHVQAGVRLASTVRTKSETEAPWRPVLQEREPNSVLLATPAQRQAEHEEESCDEDLEELSSESDPVMDSIASAEVHDIVSFASFDLSSAALSLTTAALAQESHSEPAPAVALSAEQQHELREELRAKEQRVAQLESQLAAAVLAGTGKSAPPPSRLRPPSPPSMEKKRPLHVPGGGVIVERSQSQSLLRGPVSPLYSERANSIRGMPVSQVESLQREVAGLRNQLDKLAAAQEAREQQAVADALAQQDVALRNSRAEVERLGRLMADELARSRELKQRLDDEVRNTKRLAQQVMDTELALQQQRVRGNTVVRAEPMQSMAAETGKYVIGLTGNKCAGKRSVAATLRELGASVVDADAMLMELQEPDTATYGALVDALGTSVLQGGARGNAVDREALAQLVYSDATKMSVFEAIIQPAMAEESVRRIRAAPSDVVVYVGAKLVESGARPELFNALWVVWADSSRMVERLMARERLTRVEATRKVGAQPAQSGKIARATVVLPNSGTLEQLRCTTVRAWATVPSLPSFAEGELAPGPLVGRLVALDGALPNCELREGARVTFGRDPQCTVALADVTVSHLQCRIKVKDGQVVLRDFSTNGTYINMQRVGAGNHAPLQHGDTVWLSKAVLKSKPKTTRMAFLFQRYDCVSSRTMIFPGPLHVCAAQPDPWVKRQGRSEDAITQEPVWYWFNVQTGETSKTDPHLNN